MNIMNIQWLVDCNTDNGKQAYRIATEQKKDSERL